MEWSLSVNLAIGKMKKTLPFQPSTNFAPVAGPRKQLQRVWPTTTTIRHGLILVLIVTIASPCAGFSVTDCSDPLRLCATSTQTEHQQQQQQPSPTAPWREIERVEDHPKESSRLCMECFHPGEQPAGIEMMQRKENRNDQNYSDQNEPESFSREKMF